MKKLALLLAMAAFGPASFSQTKLADKYFDVRKGASEDEITVKTLTGEEFTTQISDSVNASKITDDEKLQVFEILKKLDTATILLDLNPPQRGDSAYQEIKQMIGSYEEPWSFSISTMDMQFLTDNAEKEEDSISEFSIVCTSKIRDLFMEMFKINLDSIDSAYIKNYGRKPKRSSTFSGIIQLLWIKLHYKDSNNNPAGILSMKFCEPITTEDCMLLFKSTVSKAEEENTAESDSIDNSSFDISISEVSEPYVSENCGPEEVIEPEGTVIIDRLKYYECKNLKSAVLPKSVRLIEFEAFKGSGLKSVTLNEGLKLIEDFAFAQCESLRHIDIPASVDSIEDHAFQGAGFKEFRFPDSVRTLTRGVLNGCQKLKKVYLPKNAVYIDPSCMFCSWNIKEIVITAEEPPRLDSPFEFINDKFIVRVPRQSLEKYKSANGWKDMRIKPLK
ncbi:MAG: leucine-rich repeat domain-containing protein [Dysgonamonadaceae bacterium]|jgi:hypothetical protein|nr:leucine-rich repeat domain-containing protein [Dysgonamonadaceae bacterium]